MQVDGTLQKTPGRGLIPLGREKKVNRIAGAIKRSVKVLPLARDLDVGIVDAPTPTNGSLAPTKDCSHRRQNFG